MPTVPQCFLKMGVGSADRLTISKTVPALFTLSLNGSKLTFSGSNTTPFLVNGGANQTTDSTGIVDAGSSTVVYAGTAGATVADTEYNSLQINGTGTFNLTPATSRLYSRDLTVSSGALDLHAQTSNTIQVVGNVTVQVTGSGHQLLSQGTNLAVDGKWTVVDKDSTNFTGGTLVTFAGSSGSDIKATGGTPVASFLKLNVNKITSLGLVNVVAGTNIVATDSVHVITGSLNLKTQTLTVGTTASATGNVTVDAGASLNGDTPATPDDGGTLTILGTAPVLDAEGTVDVKELVVGAASGTDAMQVSGAGTYGPIDVAGPPR